MKNNMLFVMTKFGRGIKLDFDDIEIEDIMEAKKLIRLIKGDKIVSLVEFNDQKTKEIFYITKGGFGAKFQLSDIRVMGPGGAGLKCASLTARTGSVVEAVAVSKKKIIVITDGDLEISLKPEEILLQKRGGRGVRLVELVDKDVVVSLEE